MPIVHPSAHTVAASARYFDSSFCFPGRFVDSIQHRSPVSFCIRVNEHICCDGHGNQCSGTCVANVKIILIDDPLNPGRCVAGRHHPLMLTRIHIDSGNAAIGRFEVRDRQGAVVIPRLTISELREGGAGRQFILQVGLFALVRAVPDCMLSEMRHSRLRSDRPRLVR